MLLFKLSFDIFFTLQSYCLEKTKVKRNGQKVCKTPILLLEIVVLHLKNWCFYQITLTKGVWKYYLCIVL